MDEIAQLIDQIFSLPCTESTLLTSITNRNFLYTKYLIGQRVPLQKALLLAIECNNIDIVKILLQAGVDSTADNDYPLIIAARYGWADIVELLVPYTNNTNEALETACYHGHLNVVKLLFRQQQNSEPLHMAVRQGHIHVVQFLQQCGFILTDESLCRAAYNGHLEMVKYIIDQGIKPTEQAFWNAKDREHHAIYDFMTQVAV